MIRGKKRPIRWKSYARSWIAIGMMTMWPVVTVSGVLLWLAPDGRRSGLDELFLGLTKSEWGDIHWWVAVATMIVTMLHVVIDWKALKGALRYLAMVHRQQLKPAPNDSVTPTPTAGGQAS